MGTDTGSFWNHWFYSVYRKREINLILTMCEFVYFTRNYLCLWGEEIKHSSLKLPPVSNSRRLSWAFVYNVIHVGYFEDDVLWSYHGDTHRHEQTKSPAQNKNVNLMCFIWLLAGPSSRLQDCVPSSHKQRQSLTEESRRLHNTCKTTCALTHACTQTHSIHPWQVYLFGI